MAVVAQHASRDVACDLHDRFVARSAFGKFRDQRVSVIVPPPGHLGISAGSIPGSLQRRDMSSWIAMA